MNQSLAIENRNLSDHHPGVDSARETGRIGLIQACWHKEIVDQALETFITEVGRSGVSRERIDLFEVPGSLEIPLHAKQLAKSGRYAVIVAFGLVVNGGIYRHDFVAASVIDGMMTVQLETYVPILSVVLTPHHFHDSGEHQGFFFEHFKVKGAEAAEACVKTLENLDTLARLGTLA